MKTNDFFKLDQEQWFTNFVDTEVSEILHDTNTQCQIDDENFQFDDVPF